MSTRQHAAAAAFLLVVLFIASTAAAGGGREGKHGQTSGVYMVMVKPPAQGVDCDAYHLHILAAVLGSEERAKKAMVYSYTTVVSGFAAKLTPAQLAALQKHPEVLQALPDVKYTLQQGDSNHLN
nr:unnamed protein product [Digitaria exilis]